MGQVSLYCSHLFRYIFRNAPCNRHPFFGDTKRLLFLRGRNVYLEICTATTTKYSGDSSFLISSDIVWACTKVSRRRDAE